MTPQQIMEKYQEKSWLKIFEIHKLDKWLIIDIKQLPVYIGKYFCKKVTTKSRQCLKCFAPFMLCFHKGDFFVKTTCKCRQDNTNHLTIDKLTCFIPIELAKEVLASVNTKRVAKFANVKSNWDGTQFSENEISKNISEIQKHRSSKSPSTRKGAREYSARTIEYWIKQGYDETFANIERKKFQTTNGLNYYVRKYGQHLGEEKFSERIERWLNNYYSRADIAQVNKSKGKTKQYHIDKIGLEQYLIKQKKAIEARRRTLVSQNFWIGLDKLAQQDMYYAKVSFFTRASMRYYYDVVNPNRLKIGFTQHHIDHVFSKHSGFQMDVPAEIIGCYLNLRIIPAHDNISKGRRSDFTLQQLWELYETVDENWKSIVCNAGIFADCTSE